MSTRANIIGMVFGSTLVISLLLDFKAPSKPQEVAYYCEVQGEIYNYSSGVRSEPSNEVKLALKLWISELTQVYRMEVPALISESASAKMRRNLALSSSAEVVFQSDETDSGTRQRRVSNLVLNLISGDVRLFHHRWNLPNDWRNSQKYLLSGDCKVLSRTENRLK